MVFLTESLLEAGRPPAAGSRVERIFDWRDQAGKGNSQSQGEFMDAGRGQVSCRCETND